VKPEEFRTGLVSLPSSETDEVPECCFSCLHLAYKEFSMNEGLFYYYCAYGDATPLTAALPPCLGGGS